jgi:hypothetical protein
MTVSSYSNCKRLTGRGALLAAALSLLVGPAAALEVYLPGKPVGPEIAAPPVETTRDIYPRNDLLVATSVGIIARPGHMVPQTLLNLAAGAPAPVAADDDYSTDEDMPLVVAVPGVLANDTGTGTLTAVLASDPTAGSLSGWSDDGSFTYEPPADFNGPVDFTYQANDGAQDSDLATVTIIVNPQPDAPVAVNDAYILPPGAKTTVAFPGVLANDSDVDEDPLTATNLDTSDTAGTVVLYPDGSFDYTPNAANTSRDHFTYEAVDPDSLLSGIATVTITIKP